MEKKNDKKFNWKKAAVIGGIFAAGVAVGVGPLPESYVASLQRVWSLALQAIRPLSN